MRAEEYKKMSRAEFPITDGKNITVRALLPWDFVDLFGDIPEEFTSGEAETLKEKKPELFNELMKYICLNCVIPQDDFKIVDKPINETLPGEVSYREILPGDMSLIWVKVIQISGFGKKAPANAGRF